MMSIPKKVSDRFSSAVKHYQTILLNAKNRDVNEADTATIVRDILANVMGFDKFNEITSEYAIHGKYCDLAVKCDDVLKYLVEVKAIGLDLKTNHLAQAVSYGATEGCQWVVLTNGLQWEIHRIRFEKPLRAEKVCEIDFLALNPRKKEDQERLYLLSKEGLKKDAIGGFHERVQILNRYTVGAILLSSGVMHSVRRELKKLAANLKVEPSEIESILKNEVLKREIMEGQSAQAAEARVKKAKAKASKKPKSEPVEATAVAG